MKLRLPNALVISLALVLAPACTSLAQRDALPEGPPEMAPGELAAPTVASLLPSLLRAHHGPPYDMAAIRFGPEFWAALEADAEGQRQARNMLQGLFAGGLLFGVGPLDNLLAVVREGGPGAAPPAVRWAAPPTMRATLHLQGDQTEIIIEGQRAAWVRKVQPAGDSQTLISQIEFIWFRFEPAAQGQAILGDTFRAMTMSLVGLAPGTTQTFTWTFQPPPAYAPQQGPLVVMQDRNYPWYGNRVGTGRDQRRPGYHERRAYGVGAGGALEAARGGYDIVALPEQPPLPATPDGVPEDAVAPEATGTPAFMAPTGPGLQTQPAAGLAGNQALALPAREAATAPAYPLARAASNVTSVVQRTREVLGQAAPAQWESYTGVEQVSRGDGLVTVAYWTSPSGRQDVEVITRDGKTRDQLKSGPVSADGQGLASWGASGARDADEADDFAFVFRNTVDTPHGTHIAEAVLPVSGEESRNEPEGAMAPERPPVADLTVLSTSVAREFLQIRASVGVLADRQAPFVPPLHVTIADESGRVVRSLDPDPPTAGVDYVFAWDSRDAEGNRVPDGRYLLRIATEVRSALGLARSEVRDWIEVPLEKTQKRLANLDPAHFISLQPRLGSVADGVATFTHALPAGGTARAFVTDADGRVTKHLLEEALAEGPHAFTWDGTDAEGRQVPAGTYTVQVELDAGQRGAWGALTVECPFVSATDE